MSTTEADRQANNVIAPIASATVGTGTICLTTTTSSAAVDLYDTNGIPRQMLYNRYLSFCADGGDIYITFSSSGAITIDKTAGGATVALGSLATIPWLLKDGVPQAFRLMDDQVRYLYTQAASGTPKLRISPSSQPAFTASLR